MDKKTELWNVEQNDNVNLLLGTLFKHETEKTARFVLEDEQGWDAKKFDSVVEYGNIDTTIGQRFNQAATVARVLFDDLNKLTRESIPVTVHGKILRAQKHYKEVDIMESIHNTHVDFILEGFQARASTPEGQEKVDGANKKFGMKTILRRLATLGDHSDNYLWGWKIRAKKVLYLRALNPYNYVVLPDIDDKGLEQVENGRTNTKVWRRVPQSNMWANTPANELHPNARPKIKTQNKIWDKIAKTETVKLHTADGQESSMVEPRMRSIFPQIELYKILRDGDFTIFFHLKHMIHQIQVGPDKIDFRNMMSNLRIPTKPELDAVVKVMKDPSKTMLEATNAFQKHLFIAPDPKYYDGTKYDQTEYQILRWGKLQAQYEKGGQKYAGGFIATKALKSYQRARRNILATMMEDFYDQALGIKKVSITWNEFNLMEPAQIVEIVKEARGFGLSSQTGIATLGFDPNHEHPQLNIERDAGDYYHPHFEPSQGMTSDETGRPPNTDDETERSPRPSEDE